MKGTYEIEIELNELKVLLLKEMLADYVVEHTYTVSDAAIDEFRSMIKKYEWKEVE